MKQQRKLPGILIYLLILFFSVISYVYALHASVLENHKQVTSIGGSNSTNDGVEVSKTIEETDLENYFDITLKVKTSTKIEEIKKAQDIAVVIVMDISNTMNSNWKDNGATKSRLTSAKASAINFLEEFYGAALESPTAARKIGFVTFNRNSYELFGLSDCKSTTEFNTLKNKINNVTAPDGDYRWTNMESGLSRAQNMLSNSPIKNKYIIFITDGLPTTYSTSLGGYEGYNPYTEHTNGLFYNHYNNREIYGANYSDNGARRAEERALSIRNDGITIYSIGVGIGAGHTIHSIIQDRNGIVLDTDTEANNYEYYTKNSPYKSKGSRYFALTPGVTKPYSECNESERLQYYDNTQYYKNWLRDYIGSNRYYDSDKGDELAEAYNKIFEDIKEMTEESAQATWVAEDPMGVDGNVESIEFVGFLDDENSLQNSLKNGTTNQSDTATITNDKINWDLKNSTYETTSEGNVTYYHYEVKYRVRLENELTAFNTSTIYDTNGITKLTYVTRNNGVLSENKIVEFPIPSVVGYLGELEFTKKNASFDDIASGVLEGAEFKLTHASDCPCMAVSKTNHKHMSETKTYTATSGTDGKVKFTKIPSGHKYILKESKAPEHFDATTNEYPVEVAYGVTTGGPSNGIVENKIQRGKLKISKEVQGNKDYAGEFEFKVTLTYKTTTLTGKYNYKIFNSSNEELSEGKIDLTEGKFKLKDGEYIVIYGLPIGSKYTIKELTTNGYTVKHKINDKDVTNGATATCSSTDCDINNGGTQTVNFYNIAGYILPATGDSGMLILIIVASLLLIAPIIDIGYMFYKYRKEDKLTSQ